MKFNHKDLCIAQNPSKPKVKHFTSQTRVMYFITFSVDSPKIQLWAAHLQFALYVLVQASTLKCEHCLLAKRQSYVQDKDFSLKGPS